LIDESIIGNLPDSSGVYVFRGEEGQVIYIGKAKNLRDRVRSYFREGGRSVKTERLAAAVERVDVILTDNEKEAFLLENNLIKEHAPKYNVVLKDDKTYLSLKLTVQERFPALYATRKIMKDGAEYFGPYPHAKDVRDVLKLVQSIYPIRRCKETFFKKRERACMLFELGKCLGPCSGNVNEEAYGEIVAELKDFLSGRDEKVLTDLEGRIEKAAASWNFEEARVLKERYLAIRGMVEKQNVHEHLGKNRDVWAFIQEREGFRAVLLSFRKGLLISKGTFREESGAAETGDALSSFLFQYYSSRPVPDEIMISEELGDLPLLERFLKERKKGPLKVHGPSGRVSQEMISLAIENLHEPEPLANEKAFARSLRLRKEPFRIEIYDISHTGGTNPSGAMVVFEGFKAKKSAYRVFHIKEAPTMDDVAMMGEVIERRMTNENLGPMPDLVIIDGGKGHLYAVKKVLVSLNREIDVIGIAKGQRRKRMEDLIYLPHRKNPAPLPKNSPVFKEIVRMRDEAHRFAISSHKRWKRKEDLASGIH
jgi:excinuclease ABC subunit C